MRHYTNNNRMAPLSCSTVCIDLWGRTHSNISLRNRQDYHRFRPTGVRSGRTVDSAAGGFWCLSTPDETFAYESPISIWDAALSWNRGDPKKTFKRLLILMVAFGSSEPKCQTHYYYWGGYYSDRSRNRQTMSSVLGPKV